MTNQTLPVREFVLDGSELTIGRDVSCRMQLHGYGISRIHASVKLSPGDVMITDLKSTTGVVINSNAIDKIKLNHNDVVSIGIYNFLVYINDESGSILFRQLTESDKNARLRTETTDTVVIGREETCDIFLAHPLVSRHHATVTYCADKKLRIADNHSTNGTFVNGLNVNEKILDDGDIVQIGPFRLSVENGQLQQINERNQFQIDTCGVCVKGNGKLILDSISVSIIPGEFIAMLGPSGSGKSTLTKVLSGRMQPDTGYVTVNSLPMKRFSVSFSSHIGYVSQDNILYDELTVNEIFDEQCRLRLPADSTPAERNARACEVISLLGLDKIIFQRVRNLSGGEKKRVHLGIELLSKPSLVFLDEPLAGLDIGLIRKFMQLFRKICDRGYTLVLITHTLEQIDYCDRVLYINSGKMLYCGPPSEICRVFEIKDVSELFEKSQFADSSLDMDAQHGISYKKRHGIKTEIKRKEACSFTNQLGVLTIRYFRVLLRDRKNVFFTLIQIPLIVLLIKILFGNNGGYLPVTFYFCVAISSIWTGGVTTIRYFARDWKFMTRDYYSGLSLNACVFSKLIVLSAVSAVLAFLYGFSLVFLFKNSTIEFSLMIITGAAVFSGAILGMCISAFSANEARAISLLPLIFIPQILFSGIMMPFDRMNDAGRIISHLTIARPVFSMLKKTSLINMPIYSLPEWIPLFCLNSVFIILIITAVHIHYRRL